MNKLTVYYLWWDSTTTDATEPQEIWPEFMARLPETLPVTVIRNKADKTGESIEFVADVRYPLIRLSAREEKGIDLLRDHLKETMGFSGNTEGGFLARRRHLQALNNAATHLAQGYDQLVNARSGELLAEELRLAQLELSEITGEFTSDDLLGRIFSSFCIGK
ncbi:tRNA modification GTPase MnmE [Providencia rustigianii]|nr:tRNA modification GTPase MnmE [Providencia rustigianii]